MMHMRKHLTMLVSAAMLLCSCEKKAVNEPNLIRFQMEGQMALLDDEASTKAQGEYVVRLKWDETDEISVINLTTGKILGGTLQSTSTDYTTTFVGTLAGTISEGDELLFFYPAQANDNEQPFEDIIVDFSEQNGTSSSSVPLVLYATGTATGASSEMTVSSRSSQFAFLMSFSYIAMTGLPASAQIDDICIEGIPTQSRISWDSAAGQIVQQVQFEDVDGENKPYMIVLDEDKSSVSASGNKSFYLTTPPVAANTGYTRTLTVNTEDDALQATMSNSKYGAGLSYHRIISSFATAGHFEEDFSFTATFPSLVSADDDIAVPLALQTLGWHDGDEISAINLSTGEVLAGTLVASGSGAFTTFSGTLSGEKGLSEDDDIYFVYPAIGNDIARDFVGSPVMVDIFTYQDGTVSNLPYATFGEFIVGSTETVEFEFMTSFAHVTIDPAMLLHPGDEDRYNLSVMSTLVEPLSVAFNMPRALILSEECFLASVMSDERLIEIDGESLGFTDNTLDLYFSFPAGNPDGSLCAFQSELRTYSEGSPEFSYFVTSEFYKSPLMSFVNVSGSFYEFRYANVEIATDPDFDVDGSGEE